MTCMEKNYQQSKAEFGIFLAYLIAAMGLFTSLSFMALHHVFIGVSFLLFMFWGSKKINLSFVSGSSWSLMGLVVVAVVSIFYNAFEGILKWTDAPVFLLKLKYFIFGILGVWALKWSQQSFTPSKMKWLLYLSLIFTTIASLSGLWALYVGYNYLRGKAPCHMDRNCGMYGMYMTYAYGISLYLILIAGFYKAKRKVLSFWTCRLIEISFVINFVGLWFSYARGALIGVIVGLPFLFVLKEKKWFFSTIASGFLVLGLLLSFHSPTRNLFFSEERVESSAIRISQWETALYAFKENPILGIGYKNFEPHVKEIKNKYHIEYPLFSGHAHNNFLELLATTGILGFAFFCLFLFYWIKESYLRNDWIGGTSLAFISTLIISGLFQYTFGDGENVFLIMIVYSIGQVQWKAI
jgi:O-antigen ligase